MMDVGENGSGAAVADEPLSSPPSSLSDLSPQRSDILTNHQTPRDTLDFGVSASPPPPKNSNYSHPPATSSSNTPETKPKKPRGPVILADGTVRERKKPGPKPKPKDPNAPEKPRRKRQKTEAPTSAPQDQQYQQTLQPQQPSRQPKITDLVGTVPPSVPRELYQNHSPAPNVAQLGPTPSTPRPASSGQLFDVIRGDTIQAGQVSSRVSNASASPTTTSHNPAGSRLAASVSVTSAPVSPIPPVAKPPQNPFTAPPTPALGPRSNNIGTTPGASTSGEMDIDRAKMPKVESGSAGPSSNAPTPPPPQKRAKEQPPPLPTGSGLLSGTPFGGITSATAANGTTGTNIWLTFPLRGQNNVTINFAREVERKYGFAALHPRLAARKERQRQLAAASNALEKAAGLGSADEMSLDLSEPESNGEGDGAGDDASNAQPADGRKRRKRKAEDYDRNDEFIDDTEMAWEEQALMAKDGFFVYSGPLVAENEKTNTIERYVYIFPSQRLYIHLLTSVQRRRHRETRPWPWQRRFYPRRCQRSRTRWWRSWITRWHHSS